MSGDRDDGDDAAAPRRGEASTSDRFTEADIAQFAKEQADLFRRLEGVADRRVLVRNCTVLGLERTRESVLTKEFEVLQSISTFGELRDVMQGLYDSLDALNIFTAVKITAVEPSEGTLAPEVCDIEIKVAEKKRLGIHIGGFVQGSQGSLDTKLSFTNALGLAENIQLSAEVGKEPSSLQELLSSDQLVSELALRISRPRPNAAPLNTDLTLHSYSRDNEKWSSFKETLRGGILGLQSEDGVHSVNYELGWRHLTDPSRLASPAVQQQLGHSLKSAVNYMWRHNTFDDPFFPTSGYGVRSRTELSGLWTDPRALRFGRQDVHGQFVAKVTDDVVVSLHGAAGVLLPWGSGYWSRPTPISERFSSGGVSAGMRGFYFKGLGQTDLRRRAQTMEHQNGADDDDRPRRNFDYLGGDLYCSLMGAVRFKLPWAPPLHQAGIFGQAFVNGGNNVLLSGQRKQPKQLLKEFRETFRWSAGLGLVWPLAVGSFELSYVRVLKSQPLDEWRNGLHFGVTADLF